MPKKFEGKKVMTPKFRCAFVKVFKPEAFEEGKDAVYSITMLFPKGTDLSELKKVAKEAKAAKWGNKPPKKIRSPFRDGDSEDFEDYDGFEGMIVVKSTSKWKPGIVNMQLQNITDESEFYSGCWARATVVAFAYDQKSKGVSFALQNLQKLEDDDKFGGGASAQDDFDDEMSEKSEEASDFDDDLEV
jgi:hypothetical protein